MNARNTDVNQKPEFPDPDSPPLDPSQVRIFYDPKGFLRATVGNRTYLEASVVRAFPLSCEDRYIGVLSGRIDEVGIIVDPTELDEESQRVLKEELDRRYFHTKVLRVNDVSEEFGATYWDAETDRGRRHFVAKGLRDNVRYLDEGRILVVDVDGNRYEIPNLETLDEISRSMIQRVI